MFTCVVRSKGWEVVDARRTVSDGRQAAELALRRVQLAVEAHSCIRYLFTWLLGYLVTRLLRYFVRTRVLIQKRTEVGASSGVTSGMKPISRVVARAVQMSATPMTPSKRWTAIDFIGLSVNRSPCLPWGSALRAPRLPAGGGGADGGGVGICAWR